jgi:hypothetical protein
VTWQVLVSLPKSHLLVFDIESFVLQPVPHQSAKRPAVLRLPRPTLPLSLFFDQLLNVIPVKVWRAHICQHFLNLTQIQIYQILREACTTLTQFL